MNLNNNIMFHSVGCNHFDWSRKHLSIPLKYFEKFCNHLYQQNYHTLFLSEWYNYNLINKNSKRNNKTVLLTFDDGYLDNWVFVFPILKKYRLKGTIFINPDFIDINHSELRPQYHQQKFDYNSKNNILGFLNWNEIFEMENSQFIDIQNHSMSHNKYFSSPVLKCFLDKSNVNSHDWLLWNENPEKKQNYMYHNMFSYFDEGKPILENGRSLGIRRYFHNMDLHKIIIDKYNYLKNKDKGDKAKIENELREEYYQLITESKYQGRYETDEEMMNRYYYELSDSKKILEDKLNKNIEFLCWPGGSYNDISLFISKKLGYKASTINAKDRNAYENKNHKRIRRFGINSKEKYNNDKILIYNFEAIKGKLKHRIILKLIKFINHFKILHRKI